MYNRNLSIWRAANPWDELTRFERILGGMAPGFFEPVAEATLPRVNYLADKDGGTLTAELPGYEPSEISIEVKENVVSIKGERKAQELAEGETWHLRERVTGSFERSFRLPHNVEADAVKAAFKNGVLTLALPKAESEKPRKIEIAH